MLNHRVSSFSTFPHSFVLALFSAYVEAQQLDVIAQMKLGGAA
jgi:hypothetical protein